MSVRRDAVPEQSDEELLKGLGDRDVAVLALVDRTPGISVAVAARHLDMRRWRVKGAVVRLQRRGLITTSEGELRVTELAEGLGVVGLISRVLASIESRGVRGFRGSRMRGVEPAKHSVDSIARLLRGVDRGDRLHILGRFARSGDAAERVAAVQVLGCLREPGAATELGRLVAEGGDDGLRAAAATALARSGDRLAAPMLRDIADTGSSLLRAAAADALGVLGDSEATEVLVRSTSYPSSPVRVASARALGRIGDPAGVDALAAFLKDSDPSVRASARTALLSIETERVIEILGANPARGRLQRALDRRKARAVWQRGTRARSSSRLRLARLDAVNLADAVALFAIAAFAVLVDAIILGVQPIAVLGAVAVLTGVGWRSAPAVLYGADTPAGPLTRLDLSRPRARRMPATAVVEPAAVTLIRSLTRRKAGLAVVVAIVALAVDAAAGQFGAAAGLMAGALAGLGAIDVVAYRHAAAWQREHATELLTEAVAGGLPARRYYCRPRRDEHGTRAI